MVIPESRPLFFLFAFRSYALVRKDFVFENIRSLPAKVSSDVSNFDDDFSVKRDENRAVIRAALVEKTPFTSKEEFRCYEQMLQLTGEAVAALPVVDFLQLLAKRAAHLLPFAGGT